MIRHVARAGLAGLVVGVLVLGLGGRLAMRVVALLIHQAPHFGIGASLGIVLIGGILGTVAGLVYALTVPRRWPGRMTTRALLYGSALFGALVLLQPAAIRAEVAAARAYWWAIAPLFWSVCVAYALALALATSRSGGQIRSSAA
jgi:hypothetical protein